MAYQKLLKAAAILSILVLAVVILVYAKAFLIPLAFAGILSMLLLPITKWLEGKGVNKALASLISILLLIAFFALVIFVISWQLSDLTENTAKLKQQVTSKYQQGVQYIAEKFGVSPEKQQQAIKKQASSSSQQGGSMVGSFFSGIGTFLTNIILVLVYIFLFLFFRGRIKGFITRLVPKSHESNALKTIDSTRKVGQKYLTGLFMMIVCLWIMYSIGFTIVGVKNPIFFAIICGLLEIVPFIGNLTGTALTIVMSLAQGGGTNMVIGIIITYATVQFIQTYILEPLVVGAEVNINPLFTIIGLVAGELLWGIPGMVLAIPLMGIGKIICDHVEPLKPYGYLVGQEQKESAFKKRIGELTGKIKRKVKN